MSCGKCGLDKPFGWLGGPHECPRPIVEPTCTINWDEMDDEYE